MKIIEAIKALASAVTELFGWKREEANRQNSPEIKANASAKQDAATADDAAKAVAAGDLDAIRKDLAE